MSIKPAGGHRANLSAMSVRKPQQVASGTPLRLTFDEFFVLIDFFVDGRVTVMFD